VQLAKANEPKEVKQSYMDIVIVRYKANPDGDLKSKEASTIEEKVANLGRQTFKEDSSKTNLRTMIKNSMQDIDREWLEQQQSVIDR
jgi:hypothetical protein